MTVTNQIFEGNLKEFPLIVSEVAKTKQELEFMLSDRDFVIVELSPTEYVCLRRCSSERDRAICKLNYFPDKVLMQRIDEAKVVSYGFR